MLKGKCVIFSAPSGSGKTTIIQYLMRQHPELRLSFSVSATSRPPRGEERDGVDYHFLTPAQFREKIDQGQLLEYQEVYPGRFYGTLLGAAEGQLEAGRNVVFDVDVKGALNIKRHYGPRALSLFIQPPSVEELERRLTLRGTDTEDQIRQRIAKAAYELSFAPRFDSVIVNDQLPQAEAEALRLLTQFLL
ncbi:MAG: guanylate kinase [Prevotellaceae bacterium]|nr:guanylate kinase [Prevotellaceae bacterium]